MPQIDRDLIEQLRIFGPESATALARRLAVSTPTVTRALKRLGDAVVAVGKGRASAYALRRNVRDLGHSWPLYKIGPDAEPVLLGKLQALQGRYRWRLAPAHPLPLFMRGEFAEGLYEDLPWFLQALRPQGYLGKDLVRVFAKRIGAPNDLAKWQPDDVLSWLAQFADDCPGNLVIGAGALERSRFRKHGIHLGFCGVADRLDRYAALARDVEVQNSANSSAAGEQPKFTATLELNEPFLCPVIVKYSAQTGDNPTADRWSDLLVCESIALKTLILHKVLASISEIIDYSQLRFLESTRFDRTPHGGRIGVFALDVLDMAYVGSDLREWLAGALPLHAQGIIDAEDIETIRLLDAFGRLIGNNDMHHGNLSFFAEPESERLKLAPVYDMLPMHYRPSPTGLTHDRPFALPQLDPAHATVWEKAGAMASAFWTTAAADSRLSADFAAICAGNAQRIAAWRTENRL